MWCKPIRTLKPKRPGICNVKGSRSTFRSTSRNADMRVALKLLLSPLFPRYLFVAVDMTSQRWLSTRSTIGVTRLVCDGDRLVAVPVAVFEALTRREDAIGLILLDHKPLCLPGDKVCVLDGALHECLGLCEGMTSNERVTILLELLGRKVRINCDSQMLI